MDEKEMMERYIYEVTRRIPQEIRDEIRMELQALIEDMRMEEEITIEKVLQKLGDPAEFAKRYNDSPNYLIGPEYYDHYMWVIKIALFGIGISAIVSAILQGLTGVDNWTDFFANFFTELFTTAINGIYSMVGIVTIIFAVMEWRKVKVSIKPENKWTVDELSKNVASVKTWTPSALPPVPDKRAIISRSDSIFSIIFITVFSALLLFAPQLFGAFHYDGKQVESVACVFNLNDWDRIAPLFVGILFVGLVDEIIRLVTGYYCKAVMYSSIICNVIQVAGTVVLVKVFQLWNSDFALQIQKMEGKTQFTDGDVLRFWGTPTFNNYVLIFAIAISCIEVGVSIYKTCRYAKK